MRPRIFLTSIAAVEAVRAKVADAALSRTVGPGRAHCIARHLDYALAPSWAFVARVPALTLHAGDLVAARAGGRSARPCIDIRRRLIARWTSSSSILDVGGYTPGGLETFAEDAAGRGRPRDGITIRHVGFVGDGDTLACTCAQAYRGALVCHRALITRILALSGWDVVLDGERVHHHRASFDGLFLGEEA